MRRVLTALVAVAVVLATVATPAAALPFTSDSAEEDIIRYGESSVPSFTLTLSPDAAGDLRSWANESDTRTIRSLDTETGVAEVSAPRWTVDKGVLSAALNPGSLVDAVGVTNLEDMEWVESIGLNYQQSVTDPVTTLLNVSQYEAPSKWFGVSSYDVPTEGIAFEGDANRTYMNESREVLGVDNVSVTGDEIDRPIAVVDTGLNTLSGNEVFQDRILSASKNTITNETVAQNGTDAISDGSGHGTWATAAAAADYNGTTHDGVAPDANILALKALGDDGSGSTTNIVEAIRYAADHNASVISLSLGSPVYSDALADAIQYARDQGSVPLAASGNSRISQSPGLGSPADVEGVIGVGATTGESPQRAESAYFSQYSGAQPSDGALTNPETVDVAAPGFNTTAFTPTPADNAELTTLSGTSMATPMVAAGVHLARAANPDWSVSETTTTVREAARPVPNATTQEVGAGMFAVDYAVAGESPDSSQEDAMTGAAVTRAEVYDSLSNARGGFLAGLTAASMFGV